MNLLFKTDSYKHSHYLQYPPGTSELFYYLSSRGGKFQTTTFFGLQAILKEYFSEPMTMEHIDQAEPRILQHGEPFNRAGWERVVKEHGGRIPMRIRAVAEGTTVPVNNVLMTVESTDPELPWIPGFFESVLERVWYPMTVCTQSREMKKIVKRYLVDTSDLVDEILPSRLHDFGARGSTSGQSAAIGGLAHLVNFRGTDTMEALELAEKYYHEPMAGFSIPAMEHSTVTAWGKENEVEAYRNMLTQFNGKVFAAVSDSYDLAYAVSKLWGEKLKSEVVGNGAPVVIRPDSGDPATMVVSTLKRLEEKFGSKANRKGFRVLNNVAVIQGDGIDIDSIREILSEVKAAGFSTSNVAFGSGGALLQKVDRDTQKVAYKASNIVYGKAASRPIFKDPVSDPGKRSMGGRLELIKSVHGDYATTTRGDMYGDTSVLQTVWENGELLIDQKLSEIRERAAL